MKEEQCSRIVKIKFQFSLNYPIPSRHSSIELDWNLAIRKDSVDSMAESVLQDGVDGCSC